MRPLIRPLRGRWDARFTPGIARGFHSTMVEMMCADVLAAKEETGVEGGVASGGVFMNALLSTSSR